MDRDTVTRLARAVLLINASGTCSHEPHYSIVPTLELFTAMVETKVLKEMEAEHQQAIAVAVVAEQEAIIRIAEALYLHGRHLSEYDNGFNWGVEKVEQHIRARTQPAPGGAG